MTTEDRAGQSNANDRINTAGSDPNRCPRFRVVADLQIGFSTHVYCINCDDLAYVKIWLRKEDAVFLLP
jgi:hypothetical protein